MMNWQQVVSWKDQLYCLRKGMSCFYYSCCSCWNIS